MYTDTLISFHLTERDRTRLNKSMWYDVEGAGLSGSVWIFSPAQIIPDCLTS